MKRTQVFTVLWSLKNGSERFDIHDAWRPFAITTWLAKQCALVAVGALLALLSGCQSFHKQNRVHRQDEAGSTHIAVLSAANGTFVLDLYNLNPIANVVITAKDDAGGTQQSVLPILELSKSK